jgi:hypothetical protein
MTRKFCWIVTVDKGGELVELEVRAATRRDASALALQQLGDGVVEAVDGAFEESWVNE